MRSMLPLKTFDELMHEYNERALNNLRQERSIRRIPGGLLLVAFFIGYCALVTGLVNYSLDSGPTYTTSGPHSDVGDNDP